jgi:glycosyltransferase involved in cell wall biosynthesis
VLPRKNLEIFPEVFRHLNEMGIRISLHRVGQPLDPVLAGQISHQAELVEHGAVSDEDLARLYQTCDMLLFPSLLEGFGLPVLEAMARGCAVVSSNTTSLPEAGGDAALYFDPADPAAAASQILRLIREPALQDHLREAGFQRAREFTWERHLEGCLRTYEGVIKR